MLSVIIPTLNEERYLPRLLGSLHAQTGIDFEVIVADAGSTDHTRAIARQFGATVVAGGMPGAGRNRGAAAARGERYLFLDADVVLTASSFLHDGASEMVARGLAAATCAVEPLSRHPADRMMHWIYNQYIRGTQKFYPHAPGFCIFVQRHVHETINGFDETILYAEDEDYVHRAARIGTFGCLSGHKISVSVRRFERDGRFTIAAKNVCAEMYIRTRGPIRSDFLKYRFGHHQDREDYAPS